MSHSLQGMPKINGFLEGIIMSNPLLENAPAGHTAKGPSGGKRGNNPPTPKSK